MTSTVLNPMSNSQSLSSLPYQQYLTQVITCSFLLTFFTCLSIHHINLVFLLPFFFNNFFSLLYLFIYLFLAVLGLRFVRGLSPVAASGGHSSLRCAGLSLSRPLPLRGTGSRRAGSAAVAHGPSRSAACGIFPDQGSNPCPLH